jgi:Reverse transcriptase (RNA-dependent DNA polymerase)
MFINSQKLYVVLNKPIEFGMVDLVFFLLSNDFVKGQNDTTLFTEKKGNDIILMQVYVDDIIFGSTDSSLTDEFSSLMRSKFDISMMGELIFFLRLQIKQMKDDIFISQTKYVKELVKKFDITDCKTSKTPMTIDTNIDIDEWGRSTDIYQYMTMIVSLLYLTTSRLDIIFFICLCARYQANSKESHLIVFKIILRYVKFTLNIRL